MEFVEVDIHCEQDFKEILTAELWHLGYESFLDTSEGFRAYQSLVEHDPAILNSLIEKYPQKAWYKSRRIAHQNWNEEWEKSFDPLIIDDLCLVKASFHKVGEIYPYEIIIDPKMSFGTGHHETTRQMIRFQLDIDHTSKKVLDVGCGTGILSILAEKRGAISITAYDVDRLAVNNTRENLITNDCRVVEVHEGTIQNLSEADFNMVLANINRNVLVEEIPYYSRKLSPGGILILSGFYIEDQPGIVKICKAFGLHLKKQSEENRWACLLLEKSNPE